MPRNNSNVLEKARSLRRDMTKAEAKLWHVLRNRRLGGTKFTRQDPIGHYIADFVCRSSKLIIEIDGATHESPEQLEHDASRSNYLKGQGYRILRFRNEEIFGDLGPVLNSITKNLS